MELLLSKTSRLIIWLIRIYQIGISPILTHHCRFSITCSQYGINSIQKFGIIQGSWRTCIRILQCHPLDIKNKQYIKYFTYTNIKDVVIMDAYRGFFTIFFLIVSFILWQLWETEYHKKDNYTNYRYTENNYKNSNPHLIKEPNTFTNTVQNTKTTNFNNIITVTTDVFSLKINMYGGNIEEACLINYLDNLDSKKPLYLLNKSKEYIYQANINLINEDQQISLNRNTKHLLYTSTSNQNKYILPDNDNTLEVTLVHQGLNNIIYTKRYVFKRNDYSIYVYYTINNKSIYPLNLKLFGNLKQSIYSSNQIHNYNNNPSLNFYQEAAYSTDKEKYQKYNFKDMKRINLNIYTSSGWISLLQKYFAIAWLPIYPINNVFYTTYTNDNDISIGFKSDLIHIPVNQISQLTSVLWIGPKIQDRLKSVAPNLNLIIDYGWFWFISQPLFTLLQFIYNYINNWGISIILITIIIRLIMYPLTKAQYTSMAKIRILQPKLITIQEAYKHDKYQYHQKIIELYKKEKANPLGGCLPLLIQMPIFLALYYMLSNSVELRHAKFMLWINDLSAQDPYYILPVIMGLTMFFIQKLSPNTITDPIQKKIMTIMLIIFTIFFLWFPSGLVLYYIASNIITIIQQHIIYHNLSNKKN